MAEQDLTQAQTTQAEGAVAEPGDDKPSGGGATQAASETTQAAQLGQGGSQSGEENLGPENLPKELEETKKELLRAFHEKTQKLADERRVLEAFKEDADKFRAILGQEWFVKAIAAEKDRRAGRGASQQPLELTDEQVAAIQNGDKRAIAETITGIAERLFEAKFKPQLESISAKSNELSDRAELARMVKDFPGFKEAYDGKALSQDIDAGYDYETAFARHLLRKGRDDDGKRITQEAEKLLQRKKEAAMQQPSGTQTRGVPVIKARNLDDLFDQVFEASKKGQKDFTVERVK